jgi:hypothetical protein
MVSLGRERKRARRIPNSETLRDSGRSVLLNLWIPALGVQMNADLSKYFAELTRLKRANSKLDRRNLETCLQSLYYDDLAELRRSTAITV